MATLYLTPFGKDDPRLEHALEEVEPRIHFALNCGAKSCPPIKTFTNADIDNELKLATGELNFKHDWLLFRPSLEKTGNLQNLVTSSWRD